MVERFLRAAEEQVAIVLCLELVNDLSMGTAPKSHKVCWSCWHLAEKFHKVPQALLTMVRLVEVSCSSKMERQLCCRRMDLERENGIFGGIRKWAINTKQERKETEGRTGVHTNFVHLFERGLAVSSLVFREAICSLEARSSMKTAHFSFV